MKELIILVCYVDVERLPLSSSDRIIREYMDLIHNIFDDNEIKENYIIKKMVIPSNETKIDCIYPVNNKNSSSNIDLEYQIKKIETEILKLKDSNLIDEWNILMRSLKLRKINKIK